MVVMDIDTNRVRELLDKRDEIDQELGSIFKERKTQRCSKCGEEGHTARTCPKKE
jgi:hypothetical protein